MIRAAVLLLFMGPVACGKLAGATSGTADAGTTNALTAPQTGALANNAPPPPDAPSFLDRFCNAVASGDKAYVLAHTDNGVFSSTQGTDPEAPRGGRRTIHGGGHHADADFNPVCGRIRAQPRGELARRVREEDGAILVRLRNNGMASDLVIERRGADFRLVREEAPRAAKRAPSGGGGGGGW